MAFLRLMLPLFLELLYKEIQANQTSRIISDFDISAGKLASNIEKPCYSDK